MRKLRLREGKSLPQVSKLANSRYRDWLGIKREEIGWLLTFCSVLSAFLVVNLICFTFKQKRKLLGRSEGSHKISGKLRKPENYVWDTHRNYRNLRGWPLSLASSLLWMLPWDAREATGPPTERFSPLFPVSLRDLSGSQLSREGRILRTP